MLLLLVASGMIISLCMGMRQSMGLFMRPVTVDLGVSVGTFGFVLALQNIVWGAVQPFIGRLADRHGPRPVLLGTSISYAVGLLVMASSSNALALDLGGFLTGIGISGTAFGVLMGVVARATPLARRSQTVGLVAAAGSLGTMLIAPLGQALIDGHGWRAALVVFAGIAAFMALLSFAIRDHAPAADALPPAVPQSVGSALREMAKHRGYVAMTAAYFACGFQLIFLTTHLPQYLEICGVAPGVSAKALALIGLFNTVGTWCFGQLGARYSQKRLLALIYLLRTAAICVFLLLPVTADTTLVFAAAIGFLWLGVAPLVTVLIGRVCGMEHFGVMYGIVFLSHQLGSFFGAWMGGLVFDLTGAYSIGWAALIVIGLLAFTLQWTMDDRPRPPSRREAGPAPVPAAA